MHIQKELLRVKRNPTCSIRRVAVGKNLICEIVNQEISKLKDIYAKGSKEGTAHTHHHLPELVR